MNPKRLRMIFEGIYLTDFEELEELNEFFKQNYGLTFGEVLNKPRDVFLSKLLDCFKQKGVAITSLVLSEFLDFVPTKSKTQEVFETISEPVKDKIRLYLTRLEKFINGERTPLF